jgi:hypothetical protein
MKLLLFSDLHVDEEAARQLVERARHVDVVIADFRGVLRPHTFVPLPFPILRRNVVPVSCV